MLTLDLSGVLDAEDLIHDEITGRDRRCRSCGLAVCVCASRPFPDFPDDDSCESWCPDCQEETHCECTGECPSAVTDYDDEPCDCGYCG